MYFVKTPKYLKNIYPSLIWDIKKQHTLYLTFDDGPIPKITEEILSILEDFVAHATFFMIGDNVEKYKSIYEKVRAKDHAIGNHTFHHLNGWKTEKENYLKDIELCNQLLSSKRFRPPFGRISFNQIQQIKKQYVILNILDRSHQSIHFIL